MQKQIHVNSYVRKDGTEVKEHFRNINTDNSGTVLQGGISVDVEPSTESENGNIFQSIGDLLKTVVKVGLELAPIALQISQAINSGNNQAIGYLKPQFETKIKQFDTQVAQMKIDIDTSAKKLANTKSQAEYSKIYESLQKKWQTYQHASNIINRIKVHANNGDYQSIVNELGNVTSGNLNQINKNTGFNLTKMVNNFNNVTNKNFVNDGAEFWNASVKNLNTDYIKDNSIIIDHPNNLSSKSLTKIVQNKLHSQNLDTNTKGVIFDENSPVSIAIAKSSSFQNFVRQNYTSLINGNTVNGSIGFNPLTESNLWLAVNKIDIVYAYIDENGNIISVLLDTYDFNKFDNRPIVILGRNEQNAGKSIPYYTIINVKIPLEQWIKWFVDYKL